MKTSEKSVCWPAYSQFAVISIVLNIILIIYGILYVIIPGKVYYWNVCGAAILITLTGNILMVYFNSQNCYGKDNTNINRTFILGIAYLIVASCAMLGMYFGNLFISISYSGSPIGQMALFGSYFGTFILGAIYNYSIIKTTHPDEGQQYIESSKFVQLSRIVLIFTSYSLFILGVVIAIKNMTRYHFRSIEGFLPEYEVFNAFFFLCWTVILLKLSGKRFQPMFYYGVVIMGAAMFIVYMLPLQATPLTLKCSEKAFYDAFGNEATGKLEDIKGSLFLKQPFSLPAYFLGVPCEGCMIKKNILYFRGEEDIDKGIELYFDAYIPKTHEKIFSGQNSVIIRLHGGAWTTGDKGPSNMLQMNRYLAAQGYSVFDIQYGLNEEGKYDIDEGAAPKIKGDFTVDDMVRHVGYFLKYLTLHSAEFDANVDSVFISGGSTGGNLATTVALGMANGQYKDIFPVDVRIRGSIPFYPANQLSWNAGVDGSNLMVNPELMVNKDSPPCMIFQGKHDGLVDPKISKSLQDKYYRQGNKKCAILWMPLAGHYSDFNFSGYYNQIFLYYMERFMIIYK